MHARRSMTVLFFAPLALALLASVGCSSGKAYPVGVSFWVPSSVESFATIDDDTLYTVVADGTHDVYIREIEVDDETTRTWIVRLRRDAPMDTSHPIGAGEGMAYGAPRAWLHEQVVGRPSSVVPARGRITVHNRSLSSARATVVLEAVASSATAGMINDEMLSLTLRDTWTRDVRTPAGLSNKATRSGVRPRAERAIGLEKNESPERHADPD